MHNYFSTIGPVASDAINGHSPVVDDVLRGRIFSSNFAPVLFGADPDALSGARSAASGALHDANDWTELEQIWAAPCSDEAAAAVAPHCCVENQSIGI